MVRPSSTARWLTTSSTSPTRSGSRAEVGSSCSRTRELLEHHADPDGGSFACQRADREFPAILAVTKATTRPRISPRRLQLIDLAPSEGRSRAVPGRIMGSPGVWRDAAVFGGGALSQRRRHVANARTAKELCSVRWHNFFIATLLHALQSRWRVRPRTDRREATGLIPLNRAAVSNVKTTIRADQGSRALLGNQHSFRILRGLYRTGTCFCRRAHAYY
jgi:hypothetical protein